MSRRDGVLKTGTDGICLKAKFRGLCGRIRPPFRVPINMTSICMSKPLEAPIIEESEKMLGGEY